MCISSSTSVATEEEDVLNSEEWQPNDSFRTDRSRLCLIARMLAPVVAWAFVISILGVAVVANHEPASADPWRSRVTRVLTTSDVQWTCSNANGTMSVVTRVPSVVHMALLEAGVLKADPLFRFNE